SLEDGAVPLLRSLNNSRRRHWFQGAADHYGFSLDTPISELTDEQFQGLFHGSGDEDLEFYFKHPRRGWEWRHADPWEGLIEWLMRHYRNLKSRHARKRFEDAMRVRECPDCGGARLNEEALAFTIGGKNIAEITSMTVGEAHEFFEALELSDTDQLIAEDALQEIRQRLKFMVKVGLHYLTLDRKAPTLSGGEAQRVRLATQVGSGLVECIYILDEPSIGLHHRDQGKLLETLKELRDLDNTIVVVEHDEQTMLAADHIVDFGPGAGREGGQIVAQGTPKQVARRKSSLTAQYITGEKQIDDRSDGRRDSNGKRLALRGATHNNLKDIDVTFPLGQFICITGVSGSGKSSLVTDTLYPALANELQGAHQAPGQYDTIEGTEHLDKVVVIDQDPIGRTPRSTPATYTKVLDHIRDLYAQLPESRKRGYEPGRFSFNVKEGRCENCSGYGAVKLESDFLADVWVECEECQGRRFDRETLDIRYKGESIADVFEMSVEEALQHFENQPKISHILQTLHDVGLGYIQLGQPATTLSGGEAQRIKLAKELARPRTGGTLYILDEPTTGMHFEDVSHLLDVLHRFVDEGNSVIIVEHHPDVIKTADHIIDLGPEGGAEGGEVVASGTPEQVAAVEKSATGQMLAEVFSKDRALELPSVYRKPHFETDYVEVKGARQHNLRNIDARIPRRQMTAFSGVSGSGKTSLAIDTIYAEGQRRYVESLSPYARQFISQMEKPKVDNVRGLSPAVVIDNTNRGSTPRSTVGTVTEIYDYLRVLMSRLGRPHCPSCGAEVGAQSVEQIVDRILSTFQGQRLLICAPLHPDRSDDYETLLERAERDGWRRMRLDGEVHRLPYDDTIDRRRHHDVEIVVDRLAPRTANRSRLAEAVEASFGISGEDVIAVPEEGGEMTFSRLFACHECGESYEQITPRSFSFNNPDGWCRRCEGLGTERGVDPELLMPDDGKSIRNGGVKVWGEIEEGSLLEQMVEALA
ncbi:MAG: excinuclease ABC subunit UvrA, partial [Armatimonadota bacterium]